MGSIFPNARQGLRDVAQLVDQTSPQSSVSQTLGGAKATRGLTGGAVWTGRELSTRKHLGHEWHQVWPYTEPIYNLHGGCTENNTNYVQ